MSERAQLPESWRVYAETCGLRNIQSIWEDHLNWMDAHARLLSEGTWKRWCDRRKDRPEHRAAPAAPRFKAYKQPTDWQSGKASRAEALAALESINAILARTVVR